MSFVISFLLFEILIPENENTEDGELEEGIEKEKISNHIQENGEGETGRYTCLYLLVSCFFSLSQIKNLCIFFYCLCMLEIQLNLSHFCACPKPGPGFSTSYVVVFVLHSIN